VRSLFPSSDKRVKLSHLRNKSTKAMGHIRSSNRWSSWKWANEISL